MSQQIYNFIKFLEKKEGRKIPPLAVLKYGSDEEKRDEGIQLAVIEEDPFDIEYIEYPTEPVQLAVVEKDAILIVKIDNPTEPAQLSAVEKNPDIIRYISNPTPKVKKVAYDKFMQRFGKIPEKFKKYFD